MAEFLTTNGTSYHLEQIIMNAQKSLTLISPYLQISKTLFERLKDASNKGVRITIIYGKDELKPNEKNSLASLENITLFYFENLHAKCFFNESKMVITSMNIYEFSEKNNREMGVLIDSSSDNELFKKAVDEGRSIAQSSEPIPLTKATRKFTRKKPNQSDASLPSRGYCIRCEERIAFNPEKPLCFSCFKTWSQFANPDYEENVCHRCGEFQDTSVNKPECRNCYKVSKKQALMN